VSFETAVLSLRALDANGSGGVADVIRAYEFAAAHGVRIVNLSLGSGTRSRAEQDAIAAAPGTLFVAAAGNGGSDGIGDDVDATPEYPCDYALANVVCVAATDSSDHLAAFSNYGLASVDVAAPGVDVLSDWPLSLGGSYAWLDGTSMAAPHVAGAAALVLSRFPSSSTAQLRAAVLDGADRIPALATAVGESRRLNAYGAVTAPAPAPSAAPNPSAATTATPAPASSTAQPTVPTLEAAPAPQSTPAASGGGSARRPDTTPPISSVSSPRRARARTLRRGVRITVSCSEACRLSARLVVVHGKRVSKSSVARASAHLVAAGRKRLRIRSSRLLPARTRLHLELTVRDSAGNTRRIVKTLTIS
jgi:subtilisin family serine protease